MIVLDMEILQSAEETGGKIGNPTPYNKEGMVPLCACMKLEIVINSLCQSLMLFV